MPSKRSQRLEKEEEERGFFYRLGRGAYKVFSVTEKSGIFYGCLAGLGLYLLNEPLEGIDVKISATIFGVGAGGIVKAPIQYLVGRRKKKREEEERRKQDWVRNQMYRKERERMIAQHDEEMEELGKMKKEMTDLVKYTQDENAKLLAELMEGREENYRLRDKIEDKDEEIGDLQRRNQELETENTDIAQLLQRRRDKDAGG